MRVEPVPESAAGADDQELMVAVSRGETGAFSELFRRYQQPVFGFYRRRLADPAQAEELTQETFVAILRGASRYQPTAPFRTYLYGIAFRMLGAYRRKRALRSAFFGGSRALATQSTTETELLLREAVGKLERTDREILLLREFEQLSYAEIAELLKLPINTVRSRLFRARVALRELLTLPAQRTSAAAIHRPEEAL